MPVPSWKEVESADFFAELTPEEKSSSVLAWADDAIRDLPDDRERLALIAKAQNKAKSFLGQKPEADPIYGLFNDRQKKASAIQQRYESYKQEGLEDPSMLELDETLTGDRDYSVVDGSLFINPKAYLDQSTLEKILAEAPVSETEKAITKATFQDRREAAAEAINQSIAYTSPEFQEFAKQGYLSGKNDADILDEWKAKNALPEGILGSLQGAGRQAKLGFQAGLSGLERALGGLGQFLGIEGAQQYAEESGKEAASLTAQREIGGGAPLVGELAEGVTSLIPTLAVGAIGAATAPMTAGTSLAVVSPVLTSLAAGAIVGGAQSLGAATADAFEFYKDKLPVEDAIFRSRIDGAAAGIITGAVTGLMGKLGEKVLGASGVEGLFRKSAGGILTNANRDAVRQSFKTGIGSIFTNASEEAVEEGADQLLQGVYERAARNPDKTFGEIVDDTLQAAKIGGLLGGGLQAGKVGITKLLKSAAMDENIASKEALIAESQRIADQVARERSIVEAAQQTEDVAPTIQAATISTTAAVNAAENNAPATAEVMAQVAEATSTIADEKTKDVLATSIMDLAELQSGVTEAATAEGDVLQSGRGVRQPQVLPEIAASPELEGQPIESDVPLTQEEPVSKEPPIRQVLPEPRQLPVLPLEQAPQAQEAGGEGGAPRLNSQNEYFSSNLERRAWYIAAGFKWDDQSGDWVHPDFPDKPRSIAAADIAEKQPPKASKVRDVFNRLAIQYGRQDLVESKTKPKNEYRPTDYPFIKEGRFVKVPSRVPVYEKGQVVGGRDVMVGGRITRILPDGNIEVSLTSGGYKTVPLEALQDNPEHIANQPIETQPDATQTRQVEQGNQQQRQETDAGRPQPEAGRGDQPVQGGQVAEEVISQEPVAPQGAEDNKPFEVDEQLVMRSPHTGEDTIVSFRGTPRDGQAVVWTGKSQIQIPSSWLRRQGEPFNDADVLTGKAGLVRENEIPQIKSAPQQERSVSEQSPLQQTSVRPKTKDDLIRAIIGDKPSDYILAQSWKTREAGLKQRTKAELEDQYQEKLRLDLQLNRQASKTKVWSDYIRALIGSTPKWRAILSGLAQENGIQNWVAMMDNGQGEEIYRLSSRLAERNAEPPTAPTDSAAEQAVTPTLATEGMVTPGGVAEAVSFSQAKDESPYRNISLLIGAMGEPFENEPNARLPKNTVIPDQPEAGNSASFWLDIAKNPEAWKFGNTNATSANEIARAFSTPDSQLTVKIGEPIGAWKKVTFTSGEAMVSVNVNTDSKIGLVTIDSVGAPSGQLYQAALTFIHNNGLTKFTNELKPKNKAIRLISNMLSSALRHGTTKHLNNDGLPNLRWKAGDDNFNISSLASYERAYVEGNVPGFSDFVTLATGGNGDGSVLSGASPRDGMGDWTGKLAEFAAVGAPYGIGEATLARAALTRLADEGRPEDARRLLASLSRPPLYSQQPIASPRVTRARAINNAAAQAAGLPTEPTIIDNAGVTIKRALTYAVNSKDFPSSLRLAAKMLAAFNYDGVALELVESNPQGWAGRHGNVNGKRTISLDWNRVNSGGLNIIGTLMHEALHDLTYQKIRNPKTDAEKEAVRELGDLLARANDVAKQRGLTRFNYAMKNVDEFISALFTEPDFQMFLASIPAGKGKQTLLAKIAQVLSRLVFGRRADPGSALEKAVLEALQIIGEPEPVAGADVRYSQAALTDEDYERHAELEAKHNAETITDAERKEAEMLVERAAREAGFDVKSRHATGAPEFTEFDRNKIPEYDPDTNVRGFHFSNEATEQSSYRYQNSSKNRVLEVFLRLGRKISRRDAQKMVSNGEDIDGFPIGYDTVVFLESAGTLTDAQRDAYERGEPVEMTNGYSVIKNEWSYQGKKYTSADLFRTDDPNQIITGYDDLDNAFEMHNEEHYVVRSSNQIKSADPFTGTPLRERFNPESPDIRYSMGAEERAENRPSNRADTPMSRATVGLPTSTFQTVEELNAAIQAAVDAGAELDEIMRGQVMGKLQGDVFIREKMLPAAQAAQSFIGFENGPIEGGGLPIVTPEATRRAKVIAYRLIRTAKEEGKPADTTFAQYYANNVYGGDMGVSVLQQELALYAQVMSAQGDNSLFEIMRPKWNTVVTNYYNTMRATGRNLAVRANQTDVFNTAQVVLQKLKEQADGKAEESAKTAGVSLGEITSVVDTAAKTGIEDSVAKPSAEELDKTPANEEQSLLDRGFDLLDEQLRMVIDELLNEIEYIAYLQDVRRDLEMQEGKQLLSRSAFNPSKFARPSSIAELNMLEARSKEKIKRLAELAMEMGVTAEKKKPTKRKPKKTGDKTIDDLIEKVTQPKKARSKTKRDAVASVFQKQVRNPEPREAFTAKVTAAGATQTQADSLFDAAASQTRDKLEQGDGPMHKRLVNVLMKYPVELRDNPANRLGLIKDFLDGNGIKDDGLAERLNNDINESIVAAKKKALEGWKKKHDAEVKRKTTAENKPKMDAAQRHLEKVLSAIRSGFADGTPISTAVAEMMGYMKFGPNDQERLNLYDQNITVARVNGNLADENAATRKLFSFLERRKAPKSLLDLLGISWVNSALSSLGSLVVNVISPIGNLATRFMLDTVYSIGKGDFTGVKVRMDLMIRAIKTMAGRAEFAYRSDSYKNAISNIVLKLSNLQRDWNDGIADATNKNAAPMVRIKGAMRALAGMTDFVRRVLSTADETWSNVIETFVAGSVAYRDLMAKVPDMKPEAAAAAVNNIGSEAQFRAMAENQMIDQLEHTLLELYGATDDAIMQAFEQIATVETDINPDDSLQPVRNSIRRDMRQLLLTGSYKGTEILDVARKELDVARAGVRTRTQERTQRAVYQNITNLVGEKIAAEIEESAKETAKKEGELTTGNHTGDQSTIWDPINMLVQMAKAASYEAVKINPILGRMLAGFVSVPANLLNSSMYFSPYGVWRYLLAKRAEANPMTAGKLYQQSMATHAQQRQRLMEVIAGTTGTAFLLALEAMDKDDERDEKGFNITLGGPTSKTEYDAWVKAGHKKGAVEYVTEDGKVFSLNWARGPMEQWRVPLILAGAVGDMKLNRTLGDQSFDVGRYLGAALAGWYKQASFLGFKNAIGVTQSDKVDTGILSSVTYPVSNFIPYAGLIRSVESLISAPPDRTREGAIWASIPIARSLLTNAAVNPLGDPVGLASHTDFWTRTQDRVWNIGGLPFAVTNPVLSPTDKAVYGLILERGIGPGIPQRSIIESKNTLLDTEDWIKFVQYRGRLVKQAMSAQIGRLRGMDDEELSKAIANISSDATATAKKRFNLK